MSIFLAVLGVFGDRFYNEKGNFTQVRADINKALQLAPNNQNAKNLDAELRAKGY